MRPHYLLLAASVLLGGCATTPASLKSGDFSDISLQAAQSGQGIGQRVRWGGSIENTHPRQADTCLEVVSRPLDDSAQPEETDQSLGRFIACTPGFLDPAVYAKGREITVTGTLQAPETRKIGDFPYTFPRIAADHVYLWSKRLKPDYGYPYYDPFYDPFWGPWPYRPWPYYW